MPIKKLAFTIIAFFILVSSSISILAAEDSKTVQHNKVKELLQKMTLAEKIGQMNQVTLEVVAIPSDPGSWQKLDVKKLREAILDYNVGSILNVAGAAYSLENWHEIISQIQDIATKESRLGIPIIYGIDAIHGVTYTKGGTLFPQSISMAATWNTELVKKSAEITSYEMRASGIPWNFNPVLGAGRQPLWSRLWETFGEDAYLASELGYAYVKGVEGDENEIGQNTKGAACIKHYIGYSTPITGKDRTPAYIPTRQFREHYLPIFKAGVDAGAHTLMVNSSEINGEPVHGSHYYLTEILRDELGFTGFVVSDWEDIKRLHGREKTAETPKEAVRQAVMAGVDMSMVPFDYSFYEHLVQLVNDGEVPMARIDEAVGRILMTKMELGLFENAYPDASLKKNFASKESQAMNLQAAEEAVTLLKNAENILPLKKDARLLVTGPNADRLCILNGGWTITWQGDDESLYPKEKDTILEALQNEFGKNNISYVPGAKHAEILDIPAAVAQADSVDYIIACLGEEPYCETPGNINDISLPDAQLELVETLAETGKPVIVVLTQGRPRLITKIADKAAAIIMAYLPGLEGGPAIANILSGDTNPSGKLPITYPRYPNDFTLYDHKNSEVTADGNTYNPLFKFGFGMSYTSFEYSDLNLNSDTYNYNEDIEIQVRVKNTGDRKGKEIVQLYLTDLYASVTPYSKRLKGFKKIELNPGESEDVTFVLKNEDLAFIGLKNKPVVEAGDFKIKIGELEQKFTLLDKK
ncbi:MAG: beta-glucosidase [Calditrichaeota bacterium]|nr:MAG: beta-glucosidase [Calditrichota bacterium]